MKGRELLLSGDLDGNDFKAIKAECEEKITRLEAKLSELSVKNFNIDFVLSKAIKTRKNLASTYVNGDISLKRESLVDVPRKTKF